MNLLKSGFRGMVLLPVLAAVGIAVIWSFAWAIARVVNAANDFLGSLPLSETTKDVLFLGALLMVVGFFFGLIFAPDKTENEDPNPES